MSPSASSLRFWSLLLCVPAAAFADRDAEVVSSKDLNGVPVVVDRQSPERVTLSGDCAGHLALGTAEFLNPEGLHTVRVPVRNLEAQPTRVQVRTAFIRTDGSVVSNPYAATKGGFEGLTRGFFGLLSMGASEASLEDESNRYTIVTNHRLEPGQELIVEHQLPFPCDQVVGSRSFVCRGGTAAQQVDAQELRRILKDQYWMARDSYFALKVDETARWDELRSRLEKERAALEPLSDAYRQALKSYWQAHQAHRSRLEDLEVNFQRLVREQETVIRSELGFPVP
jgi:hypothetical protein